MLDSIHLLMLNSFQKSSANVEESATHLKELGLVLAVIGMYPVAVEMY